MRYISVENLREGMVLGKTLFGQRGEMLLMQDSYIKKEYVKRIRALGYAGIYIKDKLSEGVIVDDIIKPELKNNTIRKLKDIYLSTEEGNKPKLNASVKDVQKMITSIVDDVIENKDVMINMIDLKVFDDYTYYHSVNVAVLAIATGIGVGLNRDTLNALGVAGILHDIGKRFVSKEILDKKGKLTEKEFDVVKDHSYFGYSYIKENFNLSAVTNVAILQHHERYNGTGYPHGKKEKDISAFARILAVVDVYDALISKRPYHDAKLPHLALDFIIKESGNLFDPDVVRVFTNRIATYPIGTEVELSNGMKGLVVKNYEGHNARPQIKVLLDNDNIIFVDLKNDEELKDVAIVKIAS